MSICFNWAWSYKNTRMSQPATPTGAPECISTLPPRLHQKDTTV